MTKESKQTGAPGMADGRLRRRRFMYLAASAVGIATMPTLAAADEDDYDGDHLELNDGEIRVTTISSQDVSERARDAWSKFERQVNELINEGSLRPYTEGGIVYIDVTDEFRTRYLSGNDVGTNHHGENKFEVSNPWWRPPRYDIYSDDENTQDAVYYIQIGSYATAAAALVAGINNPPAGAIIGLMAIALEVYGTTLEHNNEGHGVITKFFDVPNPTPLPAPIWGGCDPQ